MTSLHLDVQSLNTSSYGIGHHSASLILNPI